MKTSLGRRALLLCILLASSLNAHPAIAEPSETMIVTGSRIPRVGSEVSESVTVITQADIKRHQYRNLTEALVAVPGIYVAPSGGLGAQTSIFMRGGESNHILVLIDGVRVNNPASDSLFEFSDIPLNDIQRIEITRGGQSAQYGSDALAGVIHIVTRRRQDGGRVSIERGSFNNRMLATSFGNANSANKDLQYTLSAFYRKSDGDSFTPARLRGNADKENDSYRNAQASFNLSYALDEHLKVALSSGYTEVENEYDEGTTENTLSQTSAYAKRIGIDISGHYFDKFWQPSLRFERYAKDTSNARSSSSRGERVRVAFNNALRIDEEWTVVVGADSELEKVRTDADFSAQARTRTLYSELQWAPDAHWKLSYSWSNDDPDDFSSKRSGRAGIVWTDKANTIVRADYATAFRAPTLSERFRDFPAFSFTANPHLEPETNRHWQLGIEQRFRDWDWGTTYFNNKIRHLINFQFDPVTFNSTLINQSGARIEGLESFMAYRIKNTLTVRIDHTAMRAYDNSHQRLLRRPLRKIAFDLNVLAFDNGNINFHIDYIGPRKDVDRVTFTHKSVGGYSVAHLAARYRIRKDMSVFARINNLFNKRYEPVDGFAGERIHFNAGISLDF